MDTKPIKDPHSSYFPLLQKAMLALAEAVNKYPKTADLLPAMTRLALTFKELDREADSAMAECGKPHHEEDTK